MSCWDVLGIAPQSDEVTIKRQLVRKHPPEGDAAEFQKVREAYEQALTEVGGHDVPFSLIDLFDRFGYNDMINNWALKLGTEYGKRAVEARDGRPCPKCGAAKGEWCNKSGDVFGKKMATVCRERMVPVEK